MDQNTFGDRGGNISQSKAGLRQAQVAGHYNEVQIQNNVFFTADGIFGGLAPVDNLNTAYASATYTGPSNGNVPACYAALFAIWVASGNVMSVTRGEIVDATKLTGTGRSGQLVLPYPNVEASKALVGLVKVVAGTGTTFQYGTTNFNASNVTTTFYDCARMPVTPLTS